MPGASCLPRQIKRLGPTFGLQYPRCGGVGPDLACGETALRRSMLTTDIHDLATALEMITPGRLVSQVVPVDGSYDLFEIEERSVLNAVQKRREEFAAGRAAARRALGILGIPSLPIPRADDRRPIWPREIIGSISHAESLAAAVVGRGEDFAGVGLDIEAAVPLKSELRRHILTAAEISAREAAPLVGRVPRCKVGFVAKEALFKAVYPITRTFFGFQDARVEIDEDGSWTAVLAEPPFARSELKILQGKWATAGDMIAAIVCVEGATIDAG